MPTKERLIHKLQTQQLRGIILEDSGYPLQTWLMTPILNPLTDAKHAYKQKGSHKTVCRLYKSYQVQQMKGILRGDSGFQLKTWLMTPILNPLIDAEHAYKKDSHTVLRLFHNFHAQQGKTGYPLRTWLMTPILNHLTDAKHAYKKKDSYTGLQTVHKFQAGQLQGIILGNLDTHCSHGLPPIHNPLTHAEHAYKKKD